MATSSLHVSPTSSPRRSSSLGSPAVALVTTLAGFLAACGSAGPSSSTAHDVVLMEEMRIVASGGDDALVFDSYDAGQLFERGTTLLNQGRCRDAVETYYDRIAAEFPNSRYVGPALYNAGLCLQEGGEDEAAIPYYEAVIERLPSSRDARHASMQLMGVRVRLAQWEPGLELAEQVLLREDLEAPERLEALARRGQLLLGLERPADAERQARDALSYYRMQERTGQIPEPYFAAAANYVLAESMRARGEQMEVPAGTAEEQHTVLDRRARLLLDAQREYFNTIRHTNAEWASAAGYRIGAMYDQLWHAMMRAPIPPPIDEMNEATTELYRQEYREELARHIQPLMRHAIRYWELTLVMVERTGVQSEWTQRTRDDLDRMRRLVLDQTDPLPPEEEATPAEDGEEAAEALEDDSLTLRIPARLLHPPSPDDALAIVRIAPRPASPVSALALAN